MSNLLVTSSKNPDIGVEKLSITPESAGWKYVGFQVVELEAGQSYRFETGSNEVCVVLLTGIAGAATKTKSWPVIGERMSVFEQKPPYTVYAPPNDTLEIIAATRVELAICTAPGKGIYPARLIKPQDVGVSQRGYGVMERTIHNILPESELAEHLLVVEVFTPAGHWSSYPPHKHDQLNLPHESLLEETYYYKINPEHGFAMQCVYTDDRTLDETIVPRNGDAVLVPRGYHPVSAPPGYEVYYLNVMAGPARQWRFHNDPEHEWLLEKPKPEESERS